jgi:hypothetical protein
LASASRRKMATVNRLNTCHIESSWMCPMQASLNIVRHALCLDIPQDHPASVYRDPMIGFF